MKERNAGDIANPDNGGSLNIGRSYFGRRHRKAEAEEGRNRHIPEGSIATLAQMRGAIDRSTKASRWADYAIIVGSIILLISVIATLVIASAINARANRIIENDAIRARAGAEVVERLEGKLDAHIEQSESNGRKLDTLLSTTTTTRPRTTATTRPRSTPTTARPTPSPTTTVRPSPPSTNVVAPTTTLPPCSFALLNLCLAR